MTIAVGDKIPSVDFTVMTDEGPQPLPTETIFTGKKIVLFGVPGAFTPTCSEQHLPSFIAKADEIKAKGIDKIACVMVNDIYVASAWAKATHAGPEILMLADGNGDFARATGLNLDLTKFGMGERLKRFAMIVDNGIVRELMIEPAKGIAVTGADAVLEALRKKA